MRPEGVGGTRCRGKRPGGQGKSSFKCKQSKAVKKGNVPKRVHSEKKESPENFLAAKEKGTQATVGVGKAKKKYYRSKGKSESVEKSREARVQGGIVVGNRSAGRSMGTLSEVERKNNPGGGLQKF